MPNKYLDSVGLAEYTSLVKADLATKAPLASPALTGTPTAPTPAAGDDSTKIATTEFVQDSIDAEETRAEGAYLPFTGGSITGNLSVSGTITGDVTGYLPLSGGTMTGTIINDSTNFVSRPNDTGELILFSGTAGSTYPAIVLRGKDRINEAGSLYVRVQDSSASKILLAKPDGTLTWGGKNVITSAGGTMTGAINMNDKSVNLGASSSDDGRIYTSSNYLRLTGGNSTSNGSWIDIGSSSSSVLGISLNASDGNGTTKTLKAESNGNLLWDGNDISPQSCTESQSSQDTTLPSGTPKTVHSFTLTKGTWLLLGRGYFANNANGYRTLWFSASDDGNSISSQARTIVNPPSGSACWTQVMAIRSISTTTTLYLVASQNSGGDLNASGGVVAFRLSNKV